MHPKVSGPSRVSGPSKSFQGTRGRPSMIVWVHLEFLGPPALSELSRGFTVVRFVVVVIVFVTGAQMDLFAT